MKKLTVLALMLCVASVSFGSEADLVIPNEVHNWSFLHWGFLITILGFLFGMYQFMKVKKLPVHKSMLEIGEVIFKTCEGSKGASVLECSDIHILALNVYDICKSVH